MKKILLIASTLAFIAIILMYSSLFTENVDANQANKIDIVKSLVDQGYMPEQRARSAVSQIAKRENLTVNQVENMIADSIRQMRAFKKNASGGFDPGVNIVSDASAKPINFNIIKVVPANSTIDFGKDYRNDKNFKDGSNLASDKTLYIIPNEIAGTNLENSKFEGYYSEGKFLKGSDYATTERLKELERTPNGNSGWSGVMRFYSGYPDIGNIVYRESDNVAAGIVVRVAENSINTKVGKYPATLIKLQSISGKTMSAVQWYGPNGRTSSLHIEQTDNKSVKSMMDLAEKLSSNN